MKETKQNIRYLGFESTQDGRKFDFSITGVGQEAKRVSLIIPSLLFKGANKITFQESAKICYEKLRVMLERNRLEEMSRVQLTGDDIAEFRHIPRGRPRPPKTEN
jgi:SAM-dependent methyltransferase